MSERRVEELVLRDLRTLASAEGLANWMFAQFSDRVAGKVVEVGAGIGTFSERILGLGVEDLLILEPEEIAAGVLRSRFGSDPRVRLANDSLPRSRILAAEAGSFDFALCQNVLEHIRDDSGAAHDIAAALRPGGQLGLLVPASPRLFGNLDRAYGHCRRYESDRLRRLIEEVGLRVDALYPFNLLGIPGWWLQNRRANPQISQRSLRVYEALLRFWRPVERRWQPPAGLSLIVRATKPA